MRYLVFGLVLGHLFAVSPAQGATYYVSKAGSDDHSCAEARFSSTSKLSVNAGIGCLVAGDTLLIRGGTYDEHVTAAPSGTSWENKVRIAAYPGETVWMTPSPQAELSSFSVIGFSGSESYVEFDGVNVDGRNVGYDAVAFFIDLIYPGGGEPHHIRIKNAEVIANSDNRVIGGWAAHPIEVHGGAPTIVGGFEFIHLVIHGGGRPGSSNPDNGYGIYLSATNSLIENCDIYDGKGAGIMVYNDDGSSPDNNVIRNNRIHRQARATVSGQSQGIAVFGSNNQIYNNLIYDIHAVVVSQGIAVDQSGNQIWNNTIYDIEGSGLYLGGHSTSTGIQNNIAFASSGANFELESGAAYSESNNLFDADPLFVRPSAGDFHLQAGSAAIDTGAVLSGVTDDFAGVARPQGAAYDIGAYEYRAAQGSRPVPPTHLRLLQ